jgi:hypothetical protein
MIVKAQRKLGRRFTSETKLESHKDAIAVYNTDDLRETDSVWKNALHGKENT